MATFRNRNFVKRDYECQNVVACRSDVAPVSPDHRWEAADEVILAGLTLLCVQAGVCFYGYP